MRMLNVGDNESSVEVALWWCGGGEGEHADLAVQRHDLVKLSALEVSQYMNHKKLDSTTSFTLEVSID